MWFQNNGLTRQQAVTSQNKLEPARANRKDPEATSNKRNKAKPPPLWVTIKTDSHSIDLDSMKLILFKKKHSFDSRLKNGIQLKNSVSRKIISSEKLENRNSD